MSTNVLDPRPGNRDGSMAIRQADHQELMSKANFRTIHDQAHFAQMHKLRFQPLSGNRFIPVPNLDRWIIQKSTQSPDCAQVLRWSKHLACYSTQLYGSTMKHADHQPHKISHLRNPLVRTQFTNSTNPSTIGLVDRHRVLLAKFLV